MSDRGKPLQPIHIFKKIIWRSTLSTSQPLEQFTTWTLTGVAAITAILLSNLDSVGEVVTSAGMRSAIVLFTLSLLFGVYSKKFGILLTSGLKTIEKMEGYLFSDDGTQLINSIDVELEQLMDDIADPFPWPLSFIMSRSGKKGLDDYLAADKIYINMYSAQMAFDLAHSLLAIAALITICCSFQ